MVNFTCAMRRLYSTPYINTNSWMHHWSCYVYTVGLAHYHQFLLPTFLLLHLHQHLSLPSHGLNFAPTSDCLVADGRWGSLFWILLLIVLGQIHIRPHRLHSLLSITSHMQFWVSCKIFIINYLSLKQVWNLTCIAIQGCVLNSISGHVQNLHSIDGEKRQWIMKNEHPPACFLLMINCKFSLGGLTHSTVVEEKLVKLLCPCPAFKANLVKGFIISSVSEFARGISGVIEIPLSHMYSLSASLENGRAVVASHYLWYFMILQRSCPSSKWLKQLISNEPYISTLLHWGDPRIWNSDQFDSCIQSG